MRAVRKQYFISIYFQLKMEFETEKRVIFLSNVHEIQTLY